MVSKKKQYKVGKKKKNIRTLQFKTAEDLN
jgi:hypothetical protein